MYEEILEFIQRPAGDGAFERLALGAFAFQHARIAPYRSLCERRGVDPESIADWRLIPPVPVRAFATVELAADEPREVFRSSGTTAGERSIHRHPYPELYRAVVDATFPGHCLPGAGRPEILSLVPERAAMPDSSLGFMVDHILRSYGGPQSWTAFGPRGIDSRGARSWLAARQRSGAAALVLTTSFALVDLLDALDRLGLRFRLPAGSVLFDTGGTKGRSREIPREELVARAGDALGIPAERVVREYGMTELTSHFYTRVLQGDDPDLFHELPWTRVRLLDPATLDEVPDGSPGLLSILDLANLGSAVHVLTEDLGTRDGTGFRLLGRAAGSELRGCSLTVEELAAG